jgi:hypothetical protein
MSTNTTNQEPLLDQALRFWGQWQEAGSGDKVVFSPELHEELVRLGTIDSDGDLDMLHFELVALPKLVGMPTVAAGSLS